MEANTAPTNPPEALATVFDLGRQSPKKVKKLRKGGGPLMNEIQAAVEDLKASGMVPADAHTVVVVVREKRAKNPWGM